MTFVTGRVAVMLTFSSCALFPVSPASACRAPSPSSSTARATCARALRSPSTSRRTTSPRATSAWRRPPSHRYKVQWRDPSSPPHCCLCFFFLSAASRGAPWRPTRAPAAFVSVYSWEMRSQCPPVMKKKKKKNSTQNQSEMWEEQLVNVLLLHHCGILSSITYLKFKKLTFSFFSLTC